MSEELVDDMLIMAKNALSFPYSQICVHSVALNILSTLEKHGLVVDKKLSRAVVKAQDDVSIPILDNLIKKRKEQREVTR